MNTILDQFKRRNRRGFSVAELMVALAVLGMVIATVTSSTIHLLKSNYAMGNMTMASAQSRHLIEQLGVDLRSAIKIINSGPVSIDFEVRDPGGNRTFVSYVYDSSEKVVKRKLGDSDWRVLMRDVSYFSFNYYDSKNAAATSKLDIKKVELDIKHLYEVASSEQNVEFKSARFVLRNKPPALAML